MGSLPNPFHIAGVAKHGLKDSTLGQIQGAVWVQQREEGASQQVWRTTMARASPWQMGMDQTAMLTFPHAGHSFPLVISTKVAQAACLLPKCLGPEVFWDSDFPFRFCYIYIYVMRCLCMRPKSKDKIHLCFICTLNTQPKGNLIWLSWTIFSIRQNLL